MRHLAICLFVISIISSCNNEDETVSRLYDIDTAKSYTLGTLFEYCDNFDSIFKRSNKKQCDLSSILNKQNFIKSSLLTSIKDSIIYNDEAISYLLKSNKYNILKINIKKIDGYGFFLMFVFNKNQNYGIEKNGFYIFNDKTNKVFFFKCLANALPFSKNIKFEDISTIAEVDTNLIEQKCYVYEGLFFSHMGLSGGGGISNIRIPSYENNLIDLKLNREISIDTYFNNLDKIRYSFSLLSYYKLCNDKNIREVATYKWLLGFDNNSW